jgi:MGT family glycosyltransferase
MVRGAASADPLGMSRFLFASLPATGHVNPLLPVVRGLVEAGHEVAFASGERMRAKAEAVGARFLPFVHARELDFGRLDEQLPGRSELKGIARLKFDLREVFIAGVPAQVEDLEACVAGFRPDALVVETSLGGAASVIEARHGIPWAAVNITAMTMPSVDTAPFGLALPPASGRAGRARNRLLYGVVDRVVFGEADRLNAAMRERFGLPPINGGLFATALSPWLYLQPTAPSFDYPRSDLPEQVHFVGPLLPPAPPGAGPRPSWWGELDGRKPVVLVTQGTVATDPAELLLPAFEALAGEDVLVVGVTGGPDPAELGALPANVRVERFVPFGELMPHVDLLLTNGGYGGVHFGLSHGVPLVVVGATEDKPEIARRVSWSGVGVGIRSQRPKPARLRKAVRTVLGDRRYGDRAGAMAAELASYGGEATAVRLLEELVADREPVLLAA